MTEIPESVMQIADRITETILFEHVRVQRISRRGAPSAVEMDMELVKLRIAGAILAAEKRGEERERERRRPYSILEPKGGWRSKEQFSEVERRKLLPIAETLALLDGNAFFTVGAENEWAFSYLPEADAIYQANGGDNGWAGEASFAKPFAAAIRKEPAE